MSFARNMGRPIWLIKGATAARAGLAISINVCSIFVCPSNGIYDCPCLVHRCWRMRLHRGLYRYHQGVGTKGCLWGKDPLLLLGCEPASVLCLAFQLDALLTELFLPLRTCFSRNSAFDFITNLEFAFWIFGVVTWQIGVCADKLLCVSVTGPSGAASTFILSEAVL